MTRDEINREVAEKVMEFTKHGEHSWLNPNDGEVWFFDEFNPAERINHAMLCLEKFTWWRIVKYAEGAYEAGVRNERAITYYSDVEAAASLAACKAALKAKEGK